jgi:DNA-binding NtrC family response regulator
MDNKLLLVEDEPVLRSTLSRIFGSTGITVTAVESLLGAQQVLQLDKFSVILSDMMLPDGTGADLHSWVVTNLIDYPPRFLFCSGFMNDELRTYVETTKCLFFPKPLDVKALITTIKCVELKSSKGSNENRGGDRAKSTVASMRPSGVNRGRYYDQ